MSPPAKLSAEAQAADAQYQAMEAARTQAKKTGKPVPIDTLTSEKTTTEALPSGKFRTESYITPQRVKLNGIWKPIDTTLAFAADGSVTSKATTLGVKLSGGGAAPLALEDDRAGHTMTITFPAALPKPTLSANTATYSNVYPGVDLRMTVTATSVCDLLIVHDATAAASPALKRLHFGLTGTGVTVSTSPDGAIRARSSSGTEVFSAPTPQMWDSAGVTPAQAQAAARTAGMATPDSGVSAVPDPGLTGKHASMPAVKSGDGVDLIPDQALLRGPGAVYPEYLDPTWGLDSLNWLEIYQGGNRGYYDGNGYVSANTNVARVGWDPASSSPQGPVRTMLEFSTTVVPDDHVTTAITQALLIMPHDGGGAVCPTSTVMEMWTTNPIWNGAKWSDMVGSDGKFIGQSQAKASVYCDNNGDLNFNDTTQFTSLTDQHKPTATVGIKEAVEDSGHPRVAYWVRNNNYGNTRMEVTFDTAPLFDSVSFGGQQACGQDANHPGILPRSSTDYQLNSWFTGQHDVSVGTSDDMTVDYHLEDRSASPTPDPQLRASTSGYSGSGWTGASTTLPMSDLADGHLYHLYGRVVDNSTFLYADSAHDCYFVPDFSPPSQPSVTSGPDPHGSGKPAFPPMGGGGDSTVSAGTGMTGAFTVSSTVKSPNPAIHIDHYDYAINADASLAGGTNCPGTQCGVLTPSSGNSVSLDLNGAVTHFGANYLFVRAVDSGGNSSGFGEYEFYVPAPFSKTVFGNVTGDGIPDIVTIAPPNPAQPTIENLVSYPTNHDPTKSGAGSQVTSWGRSAPAAAAPDGVSWAGTMITHRGADRVVPWDDLFAYKKSPTTNGQLYYYLNTLVNTGNPGSVQVDSFAKSQKIVVTRPAAPACSPGCGYYAGDWSGVQQILAIGPVAGGVPGTFGGKTWLVTVESDNAGGGNVWLFAPSGIGQLQNPVLLSSCGTPIPGEQPCPAGWNWLKTTLVAPGNAAGHPLINGAANSGLPDLWVRENNTANGQNVLWQFPNRMTNGVEDPTGLADFATRTRIGSVGQFDSGSYPQLFSDGNILTGETGPSLWGIDISGQLTLFHGLAAAAGGNPVATANISTMTTASWPASFQMSAADTSPITPSAGALLSATSPAGGEPLCLDDTGGSLSPGTPIELWTCNGKDSQSWSFTGAGQIQLTSSTLAGAPECLDTAGALTSGSLLQLGTCAQGASDSQMWRTIASTNAPGRGWLYNPKSGLCLDDPNSSTSPGTRFQLYACNDSIAQQWTFPKASGQDLSAEAETLEVTAASVPVQNQGSVSGIAFSGGSQLLLPATATGQSMTVRYFVPVGGLYTISSAMTKSIDYGKITVTVDSSATPLPNTFDGYAGAVTAPSPFTFGTASLATGWHTFTFTVTGTNPATTGNHYMIGVDSLGLAFAQATAPVAKLSLPGSVAAPAPVTADGAASASGGAAIVQYTVNFGDGTTVTGTAAKTSHSYQWTGSPATYTVTLTATDATGKSSSTSGQVTITAPVGPTAKVDAAATAPTGVQVPISAASSTSGSSTISTYTFDYGDGTPVSAGTSPSTSHIYANAGTYTITLTENDAENLTSTSTTSITIGSWPAVGYVQRVSSEALATGITPATVVTLHPAKDTAPGNSLVVSVMLTNVFYGTVTAADTAGDAFSVVNDVNNGTVGHRLVMLSAFKTRGLNMSDTITVTFTKSAEHQIAVDEYSGIKGVDTTSGATGPATSVFNSSATAATRSGELVVGIAGIHKTAPPSFTAGWTALPSLQVPTGQQPDYLISGWQTASAPGSFTATGSSTGMWMSEVATFAPNVVTAGLSATPTAGLAPLSVNFDAGKSSAGPNPIAGYAFDFGDGNTVPAGTSTTASHSYVSAGNYTAKVTVTDVAGRTDTATVPITVTSALKPLKDNGMVAYDVSPTATSPTTSVALHPLSTVPAADSLVMSMMLVNSGGVNPTGSVTATDTQGNTYTQVGTTRADNGGDFLVSLAAINIHKALSTSDTITVNWPSNKEHFIAVEDFTGVTAVDQTTTTSTTPSPLPGPFSSGSVATTAANELLYGFAGFTGGSLPVWDSGWAPGNMTLVTNRTDRLLTSARLVNALGTYQASGTNAKATYIAGIVALR